ncbi:MAG: MGMT family protein [Bacteroidales bacterium]|nr:MGMT family protein [Bacteroidales bacterium]
MDDIRQKVIDSTMITPFQRKVYLELLNVPSGTTITYGELARRIGCGSAQAVGQALKRNPFAPEVPCHRVVAADGLLGGYNGKREGEQLERKRQLLYNEKIINKI